MIDTWWWIGKYSEGGRSGQIAVVPGIFPQGLPKRTGLSEIRTTSYIKTNQGNISIRFTYTSKPHGTVILAFTTGSQRMEEDGRKGSWTNLRFIASFAWKDWGKLRTACRNCRDLNPGYPKYEAGVLPVRVLCSRLRCWLDGNWIRKWCELQVPYDICLEGPNPEPRKYGAEAPTCSFRPASRAKSAKEVWYLYNQLQNRQSRRAAVNCTAINTTRHQDGYLHSTDIPLAASLAQGITGGDAIFLQITLLKLTTTLTTGCLPSSATKQLFAVIFYNQSPTSFRLRQHLLQHYLQIQMLLISWKFVLNYATCNNLWGTR
jgi:hypothetical protein